MPGREPLTKIVRQLRSGQVTIPAEFRKVLGIDSKPLLQVTLVSGELRIRPVRLDETGAGSAWLKELYERFAPVRVEAAQVSQGEIDADIDRAVTAVRKSHA